MSSPPVSAVNSAGAAASQTLLASAGKPEFVRAVGVPGRDALGRMELFRRGCDYFAKDSSGTQYPLSYGVSEDEAVQQIRNTLGGGGYANAFGRTGAATGALSASRPSAAQNRAEAAASSETAALANAVTAQQKATHPNHGSEHVSALKNTLAGYSSGGLGATDLRIARDAAAAVLGDPKALGTESRRYLEDFYRQAQAKLTTADAQAQSKAQAQAQARRQAAEAGDAAVKALGVAINRFDRGAGRDTLNAALAAARNADKSGWTPAQHKGFTAYEAQASTRLWPKANPQLAPNERALARDGAAKARQQRGKQEEASQRPIAAVGAQAPDGRGLQGDLVWLDSTRQWALKGTTQLYRMPASVQLESQAAAYARQQIRSGGWGQLRGLDPRYLGGQDRGKQTAQYLKGLRQRVDIAAQEIGDWDLTWAALADSRNNGQKVLDVVREAFGDDASSLAPYERTRSELQGIYQKVLERHINTGEGQRQVQALMAQRRAQHQQRIARFGGNAETGAAVTKTTAQLSSTTGAWIVGGYVRVKTGSPAAAAAAAAGFSASNRALQNSLSWGVNNLAAHIGQTAEGPDKDLIAKANPLTRERLLEDATGVTTDAVSVFTGLTASKYLAPAGGKLVSLAAPLVTRAAPLLAPLAPLVQPVATKLAPLVQPLVNKAMPVLTPLAQAAQQTVSKAATRLGVTALPSANELLGNGLGNAGVLPLIRWAGLAPSAVNAKINESLQRSDLDKEQAKLQAAHPGQRDTALQQTRQQWGQAKNDWIARQRADFERQVQALGSRADPQRVQQVRQQQYKLINDEAYARFESGQRQALQAQRGNLEGRHQLQLGQLQDQQRALAEQTEKSIADQVSITIRSTPSDALISGLGGMLVPSAIQKPGALPGTIQWRALPLAGEMALGASQGAMDTLVTSQVTGAPITAQDLASNVLSNMVTLPTILVGTKSIRPATPSRPHTSAPDTGMAALRGGNTQSVEPASVVSAGINTGLLERLADVRQRLAADPTERTALQQAKQLRTQLGKQLERIERSLDINQGEQRRLTNAQKPEAAAQAARLIESLEQQRTHLLDAWRPVGRAAGLDQPRVRLAQHQSPLVAGSVKSVEMVAKHGPRALMVGGGVTLGLTGANVALNLVPEVRTGAPIVNASQEFAKLVGDPDYMKKNYSDPAGNVPGHVFVEQVDGEPRHFITAPLDLYQRLFAEEVVFQGDTQTPGSLWRDVRLPDGREMSVEVRPPFRDPSQWKIRYYFQTEDPANPYNAVSDIRLAFGPVYGRSTELTVGALRGSNTRNDTILHLGLDPLTLMPNWSDFYLRQQNTTRAAVASFKFSPISYNPARVENLSVPSKNSTTGLEIGSVVGYSLLGVRDLQDIRFNPQGAPKASSVFRGTGLWEPGIAYLPVSVFGTHGDKSAWTVTPLQPYIEFPMYPLDARLTADPRSGIRPSFKPLNLGLPEVGLEVRSRNVLPNFLSPTRWIESLSKAFDASVPSPLPKPQPYLPVTVGRARNDDRGDPRTGAPVAERRPGTDPQDRPPPTTQGGPGRAGGSGAMSVDDRGRDFENRVRNVGGVDESADPRGNYRWDGETHHVSPDPFDALSSKADNDGQPRARQDPAPSINRQPTADTRTVRLGPGLARKQFQQQLAERVHGTAAAHAGATMLMEQLHAKGWVLEFDPARALKKQGLEVNRDERTLILRGLTKGATNTALTPQVLVGFLANVVGAEDAGEPRPLEQLHGNFPGIGWDRVPWRLREQVILWSESNTFGADLSAYMAQQSALLHEGRPSAGDLDALAQSIARDAAEAARSLGLEDDIALRHAMQAAQTQASTPRSQRQSSAVVPGAHSQFAQWLRALGMDAKHPVTRLAAKLANAGWEFVYDPSGREPLFGSPVWTDSDRREVRFNPSMATMDAPWLLQLLQGSLDMNDAAPPREVLRTLYPALKVDSLHASENALLLSWMLKPDLFGADAQDFSNRFARPFAEADVYARVNPQAPLDNKTAAFFGPMMTRIAGRLGFDSVNALRGAMDHVAVAAPGAQRSSQALLAALLVTREHLDAALPLLRDGWLFDVDSSISPGQAKIDLAARRIVFGADPKRVAHVIVPTLTTAANQHHQQQLREWAPHLEWDRLTASQAAAVKAWSERGQPADANDAELAAAARALGFSDAHALGTAMQGRSTATVPTPAEWRELGFQPGLAQALSQLTPQRAHLLRNVLNDPARAIANPQSLRLGTDGRLDPLDELPRLSALIGIDKLADRSASRPMNNATPQQRVVARFVARLAGAGDATLATRLSAALDSIDDSSSATSPRSDTSPAQATARQEPIQTPEPSRPALPTDPWSRFLATDVDAQGGIPAHWPEALRQPQGDTAALLNAVIEEPQAALVDPVTLLAQRAGIDTESATAVTRELLASLGAADLPRHEWGPWLLRLIGYAGQGPVSARLRQEVAVWERDAASQEPTAERPTPESETTPPDETTPRSTADDQPAEAMDTPAPRRAPAALLQPLVDAPMNQDVKLTPALKKLREDASAIAAAIDRHNAKTDAPPIELAPADAFWLALQRRDAQFETKPTDDGDRAVFVAAKTPRRNLVETVWNLVQGDTPTRDIPDFVPLSIAAAKKFDAVVFDNAPHANTRTRRVMEFIENALREKPLPPDNPLAQAAHAVLGRLLDGGGLDADTARQAMRSLGLDHDADDTTPTLPWSKADSRSGNETARWTLPTENISGYPTTRQVWLARQAEQQRQADLVVKALGAVSPDDAAAATPGHFLFTVGLRALRDGHADAAQQQFDRALASGQTPDAQPLRAALLPELDASDSFTHAVSEAFIDELRSSIDFALALREQGGWRGSPLTLQQATAATQAYGRAEAALTAPPGDNETPRQLLLALPHAKDNRLAGFATLSKLGRQLPRSVVVWTTSPHLAAGAALKEAQAMLPGWHVVATPEDLAQAVADKKRGQPVIAVLSDDALSKRGGFIADLVQRLSQRGVGTPFLYVPDQAQRMTAGSARAAGLKPLVERADMTVPMSDTPVSRDVGGLDDLGRWLGLIDAERERGASTDPRLVYGRMAQHMITGSARRPAPEPQYEAIEYTPDQSQFRDEVATTADLGSKERIHWLTRLGIEAKLPFISKRVAQRLDQQGKVVVISRYVDDGVNLVAKDLKQALPQRADQILAIDGSTSPADRQEALRRFGLPPNAKGALNVLVMLDDTVKGDTAVDPAHPAPGGYESIAADPPRTPAALRAMTSLFDLDRLPQTVEVQVSVPYMKLPDAESGKGELTRDQKDIVKLNTRELRAAGALGARQGEDTQTATELQLGRLSLSQRFPGWGTDAVTDLPAVERYLQNSDRMPASQQTRAYIENRVRLLAAAMRHRGMQPRLLDLGSGQNRLVSQTLIEGNGPGPTAKIDSGVGIDQIPVALLQKQVDQGLLDGSAVQSYVEGLMQNAPTLLPGRKFNIVTANLSLIADDPRTMARYFHAANEMLEPHGRFVLTRPLSEFSPQRLDTLYEGLDRMGFEVVRDRRLVTQGGAMRYIELERVRVRDAQPISDETAALFQFRGAAEVKTPPPQNNADDPPAQSVGAAAKPKPPRVADWLRFAQDAALPEAVIRAATGLPVALPRRLETQTAAASQQDAAAPAGLRLAWARKVTQGVKTIEQAREVYFRELAAYYRSGVNPALANRRAFVDGLLQDDGQAVEFIGLPGLLKPINDRVGHGAGDKLLIHVLDAAADVRRQLPWVTVFHFDALNLGTKGDFGALGDAFAARMKGLQLKYVADGVVYSNRTDDDAPDPSVREGLPVVRVRLDPKAAGSPKELLAQGIDALDRASEPLKQPEAEGGTGELDPERGAHLRKLKQAPASANDEPLWVNDPGLDPARQPKNDERRATQQLSAAMLDALQAQTDRVIGSDPAQLPAAKRAIEDLVFKAFSTDESFGRHLGNQLAFDRAESERKFHFIRTLHGFIDVGAVGVTNRLVSRFGGDAVLTAVHATAAEVARRINKRMELTGGKALEVFAVGGDEIRFISSELRVLRRFEKAFTLAMRQATIEGIAGDTLAARQRVQLSDIPVYIGIGKTKEQAEARSNAAKAGDPQRVPGQLPPSYRVSPLGGDEPAPNNDQVLQPLVGTRLIERGQLTAEVVIRITQARRELAAEVGQQPQDITLDIAVLKVGQDYWTARIGREADAFERARGYQSQLEQAMAPLRQQATARKAADSELATLRSDYEQTLAAIQEVKPDFDGADIGRTTVGEVTLQQLEAAMPPADHARLSLQIARQYLDHYRAAAQPTSASSAVQRFLSQVEPNLRARWEAQLVGGAPLHSLLLRQARAGQPLDAHSVDHLVALNEAGRPLTTDNIDRAVSRNAPGTQPPQMTDPHDGSSRETQ